MHNASASTRLPACGHLHAHVRSITLDEWTLWPTLLFVVLCLMPAQVRSVTLDEWTMEHVESLARAGGNDAANAYYEATLPSGVRPGMCVRAGAACVRCVRACVRCARVRAGQGAPCSAARLQRPGAGPLPHVSQGGS